MSSSSRRRTQGSVAPLVPLLVLVLGGCSGSDDAPADPDAERYEASGDDFGFAFEAPRELGELREDEDVASESGGTDVLHVLGSGDGDRVLVTALTADDDSPEAVLIAFRAQSGLGTLSDPDADIVEWEGEPSGTEVSGTDDALRVASRLGDDTRLTQVAASVEENETSYLLTVVDVADDDTIDTEAGSTVDDIIASLEVTAP